MYWHVVDSGKDSVNLLQKLLARFRARLNYVGMLNQLPADNLDLFDKSGAKERVAAPGNIMKRITATPVISFTDTSDRALACR